MLQGAKTGHKSQTLSERQQLLVNVPDAFLKRGIPISFTKERVLNKQKNGESLSEEEQLLQNLYAEFSLYFSIGGLNNNTRYAQQISDLIFKKDGHLFYFQDYFVGKTTPFFYWILLGNRCDIGAIKSSEYKSRALDLSGWDIAAGSAASLLLSSTTWSFVYSARIT